MGSNHKKMIRMLSCHSCHVPAVEHVYPANEGIIYFWQNQEQCKR